MWIWILAKNLSWFKNWAQKYLNWTWQLSIYPFKKGLNIWNGTYLKITGSSQIVLWKNFYKCFDFSFQAQELFEMFCQI